MTIFTNPSMAKPSSSQGKSIYIGRQAIFDKDMDVLAYELLFRSSGENKAVVSNANQATSTLISHSVLEIGLETIANGKLAFINLTRDYLVGEIPIPFDSDKVVLEVLEDIEADSESIQGIKELSQRGFTIALDDFVANEKTYGLISHADIVKVDILAMTEEEIRTQVAILRKFPVKLLAEKVENNEQFELCKEIGFEYYQGYFFCKPKIIKGKELPVNQIKMLEVVAKLQNPDCEYSDVEESISSDVSISYKLLKIINSAYYGQATTVNSIKEALVIIGLNPLKSWITLLSFSMIEDKSEELTILSLVRAKMCESLAVHYKVDPNSAFTVGLFSLLEALMDQPLEELVNGLPLSQEVVQALIYAKGPVGELLASVDAYEKGNWSMVSEEAQKLIDYPSAYLAAVKWADELSKNAEP